jgi:hypothetical protein
MGGSRVVFSSLFMPTPLASPRACVGLSAVTLWNAFRLSQAISGFYHPVFRITRYHFPGLYRVIMARALFSKDLRSGNELVTSPPPTLKGITQPTALFVRLCSTSSSWPFRILGSAKREDIVIHLPFDFCRYRLHKSLLARR